MTRTLYLNMDDGTHGIANVVDPRGKNKGRALTSFLVRVRSAKSGTQADHHKVLTPRSCSNCQEKSRTSNAAPRLIDPLA